MKSKEIKATEPPVDNFPSPFLGMNLVEIGQLLQSNVDDSSPICTWLYAVLDERSKSDRSVLLVDSADDKIEIVRVGFETANLQLVTLAVVVISVSELQGPAGETEDGIYRVILSEEGDEMGQRTSDRGVDGKPVSSTMTAELNSYFPRDRQRRI